MRTADGSSRATIFLRKNLMILSPPHCVRYLGSTALKFACAGSYPISVCSSAHPTVLKLIGLSDGSSPIPRRTSATLAPGGAGLAFLMSASGGGRAARPAELLVENQQRGAVVPGELDAAEGVQEDGLLLGLLLEEVVQERRGLLVAPLGR